MSDLIVPDGGLVIPEPPDHEFHRRGAAPKVRISKRMRLWPTAIPGISLTNYSIGPVQKGWGPHCSGPRTTITLSNGVRGTCHSDIAELSTLIMNEIIRRGYGIRQSDTGNYNCRLIAGTNVWSNHAWGLAWDLNWSTNPFTTARITDKPDWLFQLFNRYGFANGADYTGRRDWMHHEFMGSPQKAAEATELARRELAGDTPAPPPPPPPPVDDRWHEVPMGGASDLWGKGEQVRKDQFDLNDSGFPVGMADGFWGPTSAAAARAFQRAAGITQDGIFGSESRGKIHKVPSWRGPTEGTGGYTALRWQQELKRHGWHIETDNAWGRHSASILRQFQTEKRLARTDGGRNSESWTALFTQPN